MLARPDASPIALTRASSLRWMPIRSAPRDGRMLVLQTGHPAKCGRYSGLYGGWIAPTCSAMPPDYVYPSAWTWIPAEWLPMKTAPRDGRAIILRAGPHDAIVATFADGGWDTLPNAGGFVEALAPTGWAPLPDDEATETAKAA